MSRLAMLYALDDSEVNKLRTMPMAERYDYILNSAKNYNEVNGFKLNLP